MPPSNQNIIDKFPFSSDANATDVGDLTVGRQGLAGQSSTTHGYTTGGYSNNSPAGTKDIIDKFSFSSDGNATDVGNLTYNRSLIVGQSSTNSGYTSGGIHPPYNAIDKFPFSSDDNASDVGDLTQGRYQASGQQV